jgi:uncharacterized linocin/CFP29 family protein
MPSSATTVPAEKMDWADAAKPVGEAMGAPHTPPARLVVDDEDQTVRLATLSSLVYLRRPEATDPDLAAVISMVRRAATVLARLEDWIVFNGLPVRTIRATPAPPKPAIYTVHNGTPNGGLLGDAAEHRQVTADIAKPVHLVDDVVAAIQLLEKRGQYGPFACVLGSDLFGFATNPSDSLVLPLDRITPFLNGPLLRSSTIAANSGVVVASAGSPVDLVVATDMTVKYLQLTLEPRYVLRVFERIALRIKQREAICTLRPEPARRGSGLVSGARRARRS